MSRFFQCCRPVYLVVGLAVLCSAAAARAADGPEGDDVQSVLTIIMQSAGWIGGVIGLMSLASATFIIEHFLTIRRSTMMPDAEVEAVRELIEKREFKACIDHVSNSKTMFGDLLAIGLRHGRHGFEAMHEAVEERAGAWRSRLFRKVEYLNIIGNLCPLLGLLGTVLGMIEAFAKMNALHGAYGPEDLAGGISLALTSTFLGLIVAIPSLGFFGVCRNRIDSMTVGSQAVVVDLLEYFRPLPSRPDGDAAGGRAQAPA